VAALKDANMSWREIESAAFAATCGSPTAAVFRPCSWAHPRPLDGRNRHPNGELRERLRLRQAILREAVLAVASGHADTAIAVAADKSAGGFFRPQLRDAAPAKFDKGGFNDTDYIRFCMTGETNPAYWAMELPAPQCTMSAQPTRHWLTPSTSPPWRGQ